MTSKRDRALAQRHQEESLEELVLRLNQPKPFPAELEEAIKENEEEWSVIVRALKTKDYEAVAKSLSELVQEKKLTREEANKFKAALKTETYTVEELR